MRMHCEFPGGEFQALKEENTIPIKDPVNPVYK
jgi:hypothetical protein